MRLADHGQILSCNEQIWLWFNGQGFGYYGISLGNAIPAYRIENNIPARRNNFVSIQTVPLSWSGRTLNNQRTRPLQNGQPPFSLTTH
jgi:hypothetical protein